MVGHMRAGVTIEDPSATWIDADVEIAADATILRDDAAGWFQHRRGQHDRPDDDADRLEGGRAHPRRPLLPLRVRVANEATVGPFAYLRPDARLGEGAKAGTFVEIKNSRIGAGAKVPISPTSATRTWGSNLGATTVTANYDGRNKNRTKIGKNVHTGVDTTFVAPVQVGDEAATGAGSVITEDVRPERWASRGRAEERRGLRGEEGEGSSEGEDS